MKVKNKLTPYPILFSYNDNYYDSLFAANINANCKFGEVFLTIDFNLNNDGLEKLIDGNYACFAVHIECPSTSFRINLESYDTSIAIKLDSNDLKDKVEVCTFVMAKKDIDSYENEKFHSDYLGYGFDIEKGNVLAIGEAKEFVIQKNNDDLENLPSIVKICKKTELNNGTISVDTDNSNYILVGIHECIFDMYYSLGKNKFKETILSLILLPTLVVVLTRMKYANDDEKEKKWYQVIESILNANNILVEDLDIQNKETSVLTIAQMIFSDPIKKSLNELEKTDYRG